MRLSRRSTGASSVYDELVVAVLRGRRVLDQATLDRVPDLDDPVFDLTASPEPENTADLLAGDGHVAHVLTEAQVAILDLDGGHLPADELHELQLGVVPVRGRDVEDLV